MREIADDKQNVEQMGTTSTNRSAMAWDSKAKKLLQHELLKK